MLPNFEIYVSGRYGIHLEKLALNDFHSLISFVSNIPYGRSSSRSDFETLFTEGKGTCSLKHGFLAEIAELNGQNEIHLMVGLFLMNGSYSNKIEPVLKQFALENIPEAHCYLRYGDKRYDFTHPKSDTARFEPFLVREQRCEPQQLADWKPMIHKHYLESWLKRKNLSFTVDELWEIREFCIKAMEK